MNDSTLFALIDQSSHFAFKKQKELMMYPDDPKVRSWLKVLDVIQPKNVYGIEVTYIPRDA